jgi:hypothetical protein
MFLPFSRIQIIVIQALSFKPFALHFLVLTLFFSICRTGAGRLVRGCGSISAGGRCCDRWSCLSVWSSMRVGGSGSGKRYMGREQVVIGDEVSFL